MNNPIPTTMEELSRELPMELVSEVLARLPVKSLVRLRCVCKAWCSLISSPDFALLHLDRYHNQDDDGPFLAATSDFPRKWMFLSSHTYEKLVPDDYAYAMLSNQHVMSHCACFEPQGSSVNGLILLSRNYLVLGRLQGQHYIHRDIMLWNPTIGKTHKLPPHGTNCSAYLGLGFSRSRNDYKVVAIAKQPETSVYIYSLGTNTWRRIVEYEESIICHLYSNGFHLIEGAIHFVSNNSVEPRSHLVSFDVNDELFNYIELPAELGAHAQSKYPVAFHDMIGVLNIDRYNDLCSLWLMENDRAPGSWRNVYTIDLGTDTALSMLCSKKNGQITLITNKGLKFNDVESGEVKHVTDLYIYCTLYKESLVLL